MLIVLAAVKVVAGGHKPNATAAGATFSSAAPNDAVSASGPQSSAPSTPAVPAGTDDPSGVPMPRGDLPGWHQTFADDFTGTQVNRKKWYVFDGQPLGDPAAQFVPSHISVADGMVTIGAWPMSTARGPIYASGGMSNVVNFSQGYGRYDVRFRMDRGWGIAYALLLWPSDNKSKPEIDFAEDNGKVREMTSATSHPIGPGEKHLEVEGNFTQWHTAEVVWSAKKLTYSIDGKVWGTMTGIAVPKSTPMSISLQTQSHACGDTWEACPDDTTPPKVNLQVDWVTAYVATRK
ncbi:MAG TPA: glycoside hydrolase family 16 protein [Micromonosporaceae bacterium]|nr:glycoside hydrolase family 16 protein [Micromonosporaceae bacterium]